MKFGKSRMLLIVGAILVISAVLSCTLPALASGVTSVSAYPNKYTYSLSEMVTLNVRATWDTSGLAAIMACVQYVITIKEVTWFGLWKTEVTQASYTGNCYYGRLPNPVYITKAVSFAASKLGRGTHTLYAEVKFASYVLFGSILRWDTRSSTTVKLTVV